MSIDPNPYMCFCESAILNGFMHILLKFLYSYCCCVIECVTYERDRDMSFRFWCGETNTERIINMRTRNDKNKSYVFNDERTPHLIVNLQKKQTVFGVKLRNVFFYYSLLGMLSFCKKKITLNIKREYLYE